jgi:hypothetical protein
MKINQRKNHKKSKRAHKFLVKKAEQFNQKKTVIRNEEVFRAKELKIGYLGYLKALILRLEQMSITCFKATNVIPIAVLTSQNLMVLKS